MSSSIVEIKEKSFNSRLIKAVNHVFREVRCQSQKLVNVSRNDAIFFVDMKLIILKLAGQYRFENLKDKALDSFTLREVHEI